MIKKDIVLRWTQELAKVIARMLGKTADESVVIMDEAINELLDLDPEGLNGILIEDLLDFLIRQKNLEVPQLDFLAELLARQANLLYEAGQLVESRNKLERALAIFDHTEAFQEVFSFERASKLEQYSALLLKIRP